MRTALLLLLGVFAPLLGLAGEAFYLIDTKTGAKVGPIHATEGAKIKIGSQEYEYRTANPTDGLESIRVPLVEVQDEAPQKALARIWKSAGAQSGKALPQIVFFKAENLPKWTIATRDVPLSDVVKYLCLSCDLRAVRQEGSGSCVEVKDAIILQPAELVDNWETRLYYIEPATYDGFVKSEGTFEALLRSLGVIRKAEEATVEYHRDDCVLLLRMSREAHKKFCNAL